MDMYTDAIIRRPRMPIFCKLSVPALVHHMWLDMTTGWGTRSTQ